MIRRIRTCIRSDREGQTLAIVAVSMVALLAIMSLGIDLGMAYTARAEAQRVADSAALAGASVFFEEEPTEAAAEARAIEFATQNVVRNRPVAEEDVTVWVLVNDGRVRVRVERTGLGTWFARFIGQDQLTVSAIAAASVMNTGAAECLKPWAVIDLFHDGNDQRPDPLADPPVLYDEEQGHRYAPNNSDHIDNQYEPPTGYGAEGEADFGEEMVIKAQDPNDPNVPQPGVFLPIRLPEDDDQEQCFNGGGGDTGAAIYRNNICGCNRSPIHIGQELPIEPGNMVGPTRQGIGGLLDEEDRTLVWREENTVVGADGNYLPPGVVDQADMAGPLVGQGQTPLIAPMILIGPDQIISSGMQTVEVTNLALFFIEGIEKVDGKDQVKGRFFGPLKGTNPLGNTTSPQVKILRLVE